MTGLCRESCGWWRREGEGEGEGRERGRERERKVEREQHMLHYLLPLRAYSSCACWRATCVVRDSLYHRRKVGSPPNPAEARHCSPVHVHTYIRGCPTLLPFTSFRASPHSPRPDPTPAKREVCEFHKQQQHQRHQQNLSPSPIRYPLFLDSNARRKPPGGKLKETSLTPMDPTHHARTNVVLSCL